MRKYEDFLKVKELVTKVEDCYSRIEGYSKNGDGNSDYCKNQHSSYQKTIDLHKPQVQKVIDNLAQKGIDFTQIEFQTKTTEDKITELDKKLEELPDTKKDLIVQYQTEKEKRLIFNNHVNVLKERSEENSRLFRITDRGETSTESMMEQPIENEIKWKLQSEELTTNPTFRRR